GKLCTDNAERVVSARSRRKARVAGLGDSKAKARNTAPRPLAHNPSGPDGFALWRCHNSLMYRHTSRSLFLARRQIRHGRAHVTRAELPFALATRRGLLAGGLARRSQLGLGAW